MVTIGSLNNKLFVAVVSHLVVEQRRRRRSSRHQLSSTLVFHYSVLPSIQHAVCFDGSRLASVLGDAVLGVEDGLDGVTVSWRRGNRFSGCLVYKRRSLLLRRLHVDAARSSD